MLFLISLTGFILFWSVNGDVTSMYYWKEITYENLPLKEDAYIGRYPYLIPTNNDVMGLAYHAQSGLILATVGRLREGVPSTLNAFCKNDYIEGSSPHLWGFPNYEVNTLEASDYDDDDDYGRHIKKPFYYEKYYRIISVYNPIVDDRCNRVFAVDTGVIRTLDGTRYNVQRPAVLVFELPSNGCISRSFPLIRKIEIPDELYKNASGLLYVELDFHPKGGCDDLTMYITNFYDNSIIVFDYVKNDFWMFSNHSSFQPVPSEIHTGYTKYGIVGIVTMTLGWPDKKGNRIAYYAPGGSTAAYAVTTKTLKNRRKSSGASGYYYGNEFRIIGYHGCDNNNHRLFFDQNCGVIFFAQMNSGAVKCWNVAKPFNPNYIGVIYQSQDDEFFADVFVDSEGYLWMHSCKTPVIVATTNPLDLEQVNSRSYKVRVLDAIKGTVCENEYGGYGAIGDEITWQYMVE